MKKRLCSLIISILLMASLSSCVKTPDKKIVETKAKEEKDKKYLERPNILVIMTDQQRYDQLGYSSNGYFDTPNLDRLAENGVMIWVLYAKGNICVNYIRGDNMSMTMRERYLRVSSFKPVDRVPYTCDAVFASTIRRWLNEGLPQEHVPLVNGRLPAFATFNDYFGCDKSEGPNLNLNLGILPPFEYKVIAEDDRTITAQNHMGVIARSFKENPEDSMHHYMEHPVKDHKTWAEMKKRFDPSTPGRLPQNWGDELAAQLNAATHPISAVAWGLFWTCRDWLGAEGMLYTFYDDPVMIEDMMDTLADLWIEVLKPVVEKVQLDEFVIGEDMAYKNGSIISPEMFKKFMMPRYRKLTDFLHKHGVMHIHVDSDGLLDELIPLFIDSGINALSPFEIQCGNDPVAARKKYGKALLIHGGIDKRALAADKRAIEAEMYSKVPWLIEQGGYFPTLDHAVPSDVPFENFCYYMELKRKIIFGG